MPCPEPGPQPPPLLAQLTEFPERLVDEPGALRQRALYRLALLPLTGVAPSFPRRRPPSYHRAISRAVGPEHGRQGDAVLTTSIPDLGPRLRALRRRLRVPQYVLARRLGVPVTWISEVERGHRALVSAQITAVAEALGVMVEELAAAPLVEEPPRRRDALRLEVTLRAPAVEVALERLAEAAERIAAALERGDERE